MPLVEPSSDGATVALHTRTSTYAVRLDPVTGSVRPVHWGAPCSADEAATLPAWTSPYTDTFEGPFDGAEEYPVDGGRRYGPAALSVRYADRTGGLDLAIVGHRVDADELTVELADRAGPLRVDLHYRVRPHVDVIERWSVVRHAGDGDPVDLPDHAAAYWCLPVRPDYRLSHVTGGWAREGQLCRTPVPVAETTLTSRRGVTGHATNPWVMIDDGGATEDAGEVFSAALACSGSWRITVVRTSAGRCGVLGAAGHDRTVTRLAPGEQAVSPVFAGLRADGGFGAASRAWHAYQRHHVLAHPNEPRPVLYNSWEATAFDVTEDGQYALAERAAKLGVELFVVDDGWFGARTSDRAGLGDWVANPHRFPGGLRPLADHVRSLGMRFGLWVEPEMVNPDSDLYRARPQWTAHLPRLRATEIRHQLVLDFTRDDVRDWALARLDDLVRDTGLSFLKWDFNRPFTEAGPDAATAHAAGVHQVLDRLRERHPGLRVEACAGGGGRADLAVLARTDQVWTSDNTDAVDRLAIQDGYTQVYAPGTMVAWVTDSPNPITGRQVPLRFRCHVAMTGVLGIGGDLTRWSENELAEAAGHVAVYRDIRPVVQHGELYRLRSVPPGVVAVQYVRGDRSVVFAFRAAPGPATVLALPLRGLDRSATYRDDTGREHRGAALAGHGCAVPLDAGPFASALVQLRREPSDG